MILITSNKYIISAAIKYSFVALIIFAKPYSKVELLLSTPVYPTQTTERLTMEKKEIRKLRVGGFINIRLAPRRASPVNRFTSVLVISSTASLRSERIRASSYALFGARLMQIAAIPHTGCRDRATMRSMAHPVLLDWLLSYVRALDGLDRDRVRDTKSKTSSGSIEIHAATWRISFHDFVFFNLIFSEYNFKNIAEFRLPELHLSRRDFSQWRFSN